MEARAAVLRSGLELRSHRRALWVDPPARPSDLENVETARRGNGIHPVHSPCHSPHARASRTAKAFPRLRFSLFSSVACRSGRKYRRERPRSSPLVLTEPRQSWSGLAGIILTASQFL